MTAVDGVYWALALAIVIIAAALTWFIVRCAGTVGRLNQVIGDVRKEVPAGAESVRKILGNAEQVTADVAEATSVIRDGAEAVRMIVDRVREAVRFLDENVFSKLAALAPFFVAVGAWLGRLAGSKRVAAGEEEEEPEEADS
jgi:membrane-associated protease RseP (regulator of RpoE activity)